MFYLLIHEKHRKRQRHSRGRSRLPERSLMRDSIPGPWYHALSQRQMLNHWATQVLPKCLSWMETIMKGWGCVRFQVWVPALPFILMTLGMSLNLLSLFHYLFNENHCGNTTIDEWICHIWPTYFRNIAMGFVVVVTLVFNGGSSVWNVYFSPCR